MITRLNAGVPIVDKQGRPLPAFTTPLQATLEQLESAVADVSELVLNLITLNNLITAAEDAIEDANTAIETANAATEALSTADSLAKSGTRGLTMTATDAGTDVTITISAHTRVYGNGDEVAVNGGSLTGVPYSETRYVYYDDPDREGGAVTYQSSTDEAEAVQVNDRHSLGVIETPAPAAPAKEGFYTRPPGVVDLR